MTSFNVGWSIYIKMRSNPRWRRQKTWPMRFLLVCDFRHSASGQDVEPERYFSPCSYWRPSFQLLGLFPQVHTTWEFVFTHLSRYLIFQEFNWTKERLNKEWRNELLVRICNLSEREQISEGDKEFEIRNSGRPLQGKMKGTHARTRLQSQII